MGIRFENNPGNTLFENANSWHRDLIELTVDKVTNLVKAMFGTLQKERLLQNDIKDRILEAVKGGLVDLQKVNKSIREKITQLMQ